jgi:putative transposase
MFVADAALRVPYTRQTLYYHFRRWRRIDERLRRAHDRLRTAAVREAEGRERDPSAAVVDSQVVKTTPVGGPERGYDGAKRLAGRKRHLLVDTSGLVLAARVHSADLLPDRDGARRRLLGRGHKSCQGWSFGVGRRRVHTGGFREWLRRQLGWRMEVPHHHNGQLYGATGWRISRADCRFCLAVGSWRGPSHGWVCRDA